MEGQKKKGRKTEMNMPSFIMQLVGTKYFIYTATPLH